ncbi:MAG: helix-turn-helix domain-containing protein [Actinomycetota bacterium]|nr:helix-turn-helix domain-containing protein [Actinomycetota bacterium]
MPTPPRQVNDIASLRALAHPVRVSLIEALAVHGSLTATQASDLVGESPSNCSFHLRQLARFGLIEQAEPVGRERPWQIAAGGISVDTDAMVDAEFSAAAAAVNEMWIARQAAAETDWVRRSGHEDRSWQLAAFSEFTVRWLTVEELAELQREVDQLVRRYGERRDPATRPPGARPIRMNVSGFPVGPPTDQEG